MSDLGWTSDRRIEIAGPRIVVRCAAQTRGPSRLARSLALATTLKQARGLEPLFALDDAASVVAVRTAGFQAELRPSGFAEALWLDTICALNGAAALILDTEDGEVAQTDIARWRAAGLVILTLDDYSARRLSADIAVYPAGDPNHLGWFGFRGELLFGPDWALDGLHAAARLSGVLAARVAGMVQGHA